MVPGWSVPGSEKNVCAIPNIRGRSPASMQSLAILADPKKFAAI